MFKGKETEDSWTVCLSLRELPISTKLWWNRTASGAPFNLK
uniref:Uncharacterized protein n=1 Tax=Anguilla anguilla TaxID=7936 RepID=A0A0E9WJ50_ANGAN